MLDRHLKEMAGPACLPLWLGCKAGLEGSEGSEESEWRDFLGQGKWIQEKLLQRSNTICLSWVAKAIITLSLCKAVLFIALSVHIKHQITNRKVITSQSHKSSRPISIVSVLLQNNNPGVVYNFHLETRRTQCFACLYMEIGVTVAQPLGGICIFFTKSVWISLGSLPNTCKPFGTKKKKM